MGICLSFLSPECLLLPLVVSFSWTVSKQFVKHRLWNRKDNVCFYTKFTSSTFKIHIWKTWTKTNRRPFQREHLQNRSEPEIALFCYTVDKFTLPKTEKQPPRTHPESAIRHQFRFKSLLKFELSKLKTVTKTFIFTLLSCHRLAKSRRRNFYEK